MSDSSNPRPFPENVSHPVGDGLDQDSEDELGQHAYNVHSVVTAVPEVGHGPGEEPVRTTLHSPPRQNASGPETHRARATDRNDHGYGATESDPLIQDRSARRSKCFNRRVIKCTGITIFLASLIVVVLCICGLEVYGDKLSPFSNITTYDRYSCSDVYTLLASFDCTASSCEGSRINLRPVAKSHTRPDEVSLILTECNNIQYGPTDDYCANICHVQPSTPRISSLRESNSTNETCTLKVCGVEDKQCKATNQMCSFDITTKLLSATEEEVCLLSMGVPVPGGDCLRTNLTLEFEHTLIVPRVTSRYALMPVAGILILVIVTILGVCGFKWCRKKYQTLPTAETEEANLQGDHIMYVHTQPEGNLGQTAS